LESERILVCRCMEVTEDEVRNAIRQGARTVDAVKRVTQACFGLCQSKTCFNIIARIISEETGIPVSEIGPIRIRIPVRPLNMESFDN
jgi:NAD(P)H-nitrite reductase large subunit